jgi:AbiV family abortive infection protein
MFSGGYADKYLTFWQPKNEAAVEEKRKTARTMFNFLRRSSKRQNAPLSKEQTVTLLHFCFCNARDLYEEAELLRKNGRYARAFYLCATALEELAKIPIAANALFLPAEDKKAWQGFWRAFSSHEMKQGAARAYGRIFKNLDKERWSKFYEKRIPEGLPLNEIKLASLYVDCFDGSARRPNMIFGEKGSVESIFEIAKDRISAFEELHSTIDRSIRFVELTIKSSIKMNDRDLKDWVVESFREGGRKGKSAE